jgi:Spy/CpxP family protein refolding chaperone
MVDPIDTFDAIRRTGRAGSLAAPEQETSEDPGFLGSIGSAALTGLGWLGNTIDLPDSMIRDTLVGQNPFDQLMSPLSPENRATGREVLSHHNILAPNKETGFVPFEDPAEFGRDVAGIGAELAISPLGWLTGWMKGAHLAAQGGKAVKATGTIRRAAQIAGNAIDAIDPAHQLGRAAHRTKWSNAAITKVGEKVAASPIGRSGSWLRKQASRRATARAHRQAFPEGGNRDRVRDEIMQVFGEAETEKVEEWMTVLESRARVWGKENKSSPDEMFNGMVVKRTGQGDIKDHWLRQDVAPIWYSKLDQAVEGLSQDKFGKEQLMGMLRKSGVKDEEVKWANLDELFEATEDVDLEDYISEIEKQSGTLQADILRNISDSDAGYKLKRNITRKTVTRAELKEWVKDNATRVDEQWYQSGHVEPEHVTDPHYFDSWTEDVGSPSRDLLSPEGDPVYFKRAYTDAEGNNLVEYADYDDIDEAYGDIPQTAFSTDMSVRDRSDIDEAYGKIGSSQHEEYSTPPHNKYRELLLKLPDEKDAIREKMWEIRRVVLNAEVAKHPTDIQARRRVDIRREHPEGDSLVRNLGTPEQSAKFSELNERLKKVGRQFHHGHFPNDTGVIAHIRMTDRTGPNGEKILHVEEIQSDWHQTGRDRAKEYAKKRLADKGRLQPDELHDRSTDEEIEAYAEYQKLLSKEIKLEEGYKGTEFTNQKLAQADEEFKKANNELGHISNDPRVLGLSHRDRAVVNDTLFGQLSHSSLSDPYLTDIGRGFRQVFPDLADRMHAAQDAIIRTKAVGRSMESLPPDGPFKRTYHDLALKRVLREAIDGDYDKVSINSGDAVEALGMGGVKSGQDKFYNEVYVNTLNKLVKKSKQKVNRDAMTVREWTNFNVRSYEGPEFMYRDLKEMLENSLDQEMLARAKNSSMTTQRTWNELDRTSSLGPEVAHGIRGLLHRFRLGNMVGEEAAISLHIGATSLARLHPDVASAIGGTVKIENKTHRVKSHTLDITPEMRQKIKSEGLPLFQGPAAGGGQKLTRLTVNDTGLLNNSVLDRMRLTDDEEAELVELMDLGLQQPRDVSPDGSFYFTDEGLGKHARMIELLEKAAKGKVKREVINGGDILWDSGDGQVAVRRGTEVKDDPNILYHPAYHGSPHTFDKFTLDHIGSGEGAQVYGWGLYFSDKESVARYYQTMREGSPPKYMYKGAQVKPAAAHRKKPGEMARSSTAEEIVFSILHEMDENEVPFQTAKRTRQQSLRKSLNYAQEHRDRTARAINDKDGRGLVREQWTRYVDKEGFQVGKPDPGASDVGIEVYDERIANYQNNLDLLDNLKEGDVEIVHHKGKLYEVDLAPKEEDYLLWDRPIMEQSDKVRKALSGSHTYQDKVYTELMANQFNEYSAAYDALEHGDLDTFTDIAGDIDVPEFATEGEMLEFVEHWKEQLSRMMTRARDGVMEKVGIEGFSVSPDGQMILEVSSNVDNMTGKDFYKNNLMGMKQNMSPEEASKHLLGKGIKGIKYYDGVSRRAQQGTHNYVIFDDADISIKNILEQSQNRGAVEFRDSQKIVHLFKNADISTLVHESGHIFRRDLGPQLMEKAEAAIDKIIPGKVLDKDGNWTREAEEAFAGGFERYLRDGKAPNATLRKVFERFKEWLTEIYASITGTQLETDVSPELREVFEQMLDARDRQTIFDGTENFAPIRRAGVATNPMDHPEAQSKAQREEDYMNELIGALEELDMEEYS